MSRSHLSHSTTKPGYQSSCAQPEKFLMSTIATCSLKVMDRFCNAAFGCARAMSCEPRRSAGRGGGSGGGRFGDLPSVRGELLPTVAVEDTALACCEPAASVPRKSSGHNTRFNGGEVCCLWSVAALHELLPAPSSVPAMPSTTRPLGTPSTVFTRTLSVCLKPTSSDPSPKGKQRASRPRRRCRLLPSPAMSPRKSCTWAANSTASIVGCFDPGCRSQTTFSFLQCCKTGKRRLCGLLLELLWGWYASKSLAGKVPPLIGLWNRDEVLLHEVLLQ
mmetsp:Transcript_124447/g.248221  ORF Transcript_124447/g.248221 Transcript_124447/m.248221 type:complete len:276 (-) Transcript_124447:68-895(-)